MTYELKYDEKFQLYLHKKIKGEGSVQYLFRFENGYGASIVKNLGSWGRNQDLWELAVISWPEESDMFKIVFDIRSVTMDVVGWLNDDDVNMLLEKIMQLNEWGK